MKLRKKQTYLNSIPEGSPRKRIMALLAKILYFTIIGAALIYIAAYFIIHYYLYIFTTAQVDIQKYYVEANRDCEVLEYFVTKGQQVKVGDKLVEISSQQSNDSKKRFLYTEKLSTEHQISNAEAKLKVMKEHLAERKREREKYLLLHNVRKIKSDDYSFLSTRTRVYSAITKDMNDLDLKIKLLEAELKNLEAYGKRLDKEDTMEGSFKFDEVLVSRFNGVVDKLNLHVYEFAYRGETIITIEDPEQIIIKAYFEPEYLNYLYEGKKVRIIFSDGKVSEGIIKKVYSSALQYNTNVVNITRGSIKVMTDIYPVDENESKIWKSYIGMELRVRITRSRK